MWWYIPTPLPFSDHTMIWEMLVRLWLWWTVLGLSSSRALRITVCSQELMLPNELNFFNLKNYFFLKFLWTAFETLFLPECHTILVPTLSQKVANPKCSKDEALLYLKPPLSWPYKQQSKTRPFELSCTTADCDQQPPSEWDPSQSQLILKFAMLGGLPGWWILGQYLHFSGLNPLASMHRHLKYFTIFREIFTATLHWLLMSMCMLYQIWEKCWSPRCLSTLAI